METVSEETVQGDTPEVDTGTPSTSDPVASSDLDNSLAAILLADYPEDKPATPEAGEPAQSGNEEATDDEAEDPDIEAPEKAADVEEPDKPVPTLEDWNAKVREKPRSINEAPNKLHPQIMESVLNAERDVQRQAVTIAYQQGIDAGTKQAAEQAQVAAAIAQIDQLRKDDPEAYLSWTDEHPDRAQAYLQYKQRGRVPAQVQQPDFTPVQDSAKAQISRLDEFPEARTKVLAAMQAEDIRATPAGLKRLTELVTDELVEARIAKRNKDEEPARKALEKRQEAASTRKAVPRPDVGSGSGATGGENLDNLSPWEMIAKGMASDLAAARR